MDIEKECKRCKKTKSGEMFGKHRGQPDGLDVYCKFCKSEMKIAVRNSGDRRKKAESVARTIKYYAYYT